MTSLAGVVVRAKKAYSSSKDKSEPTRVSYGTDWYEQTRAATRPRRTVREEMGEWPLAFGDAARCLTVLNPLDCTEP